MADEESDIFEITDFTTASEWERFIAHLEEVIRDWKLTDTPTSQPATKDEFTNGLWKMEEESLHFAGEGFKVIRHVLRSRSLQDKTESSNNSEGEGVNTDHEVSQVLRDMMDHENDFPSVAHPLTRWYGLRDFVIISPVNVISNNESKVNLLMSSVSVAVNNTGCQTPVFVQIDNQKRQFYQGLFESPGLKTSFEMVHLRKTPPQYKYLAGLLNVFRSKLACLSTNNAPINVAVRFTYVLSDWPQHVWPQLPPDIDSMTEDSVGITSFDCLPFGALQDPISELHLLTSWPSLSDDMIVDNDQYSDLDPLQAPVWSVRIRLTEDTQCLLGKYLRRMIAVCHRRESTQQLIGRHVSQDDDKDISLALQRLTEPGATYIPPSVSKVVNTASSKLKMKPGESPIHEKLLNKILMFLFPDASNNSNKEEFSEESGIQSDIQEACRGFKSSPLNSLAQRLAVCMCILNHSHGGLPAVAHLWQEFVLEMRYRLDNSYFISGLEKGPPNLGYCLLYQKLQMLNCCIARKRAREKQEVPEQTIKSKTSPSKHNCDKDGLDNEDSNIKRKKVVYGQGVADSTNGSDDDDNDEDDDEDDNDKKDDNAISDIHDTDVCDSIEDGDSKSSDEDEFFECDETSEQQQQVKDNTDANISAMDDHNTKNDEINCKLTKSETGTSLESADYVDSIDRQPEGRMRPFGDDLRLVHNSGELLYIPITQEPAPMTEDMLEEHADVLTKLGTSSEGAHLRARMQSACLLSDMESFKAANPGCTIEDFVRWYSPRDWIETEVIENDQKIKRGELSQRMKIPGNMWTEVWNSAKPVPARRQKRLFDDTKEAEKVLHFLASRKPARVCLDLMPMVVQEAMKMIIECDEIKHVPSLKILVEKIQMKTSAAMRSQNITKYEEVVKNLSQIETVIARNKSLKAKFSSDGMKDKGAQHTVDTFLTTLLENPEVNVIGASRGPPGSVIHQLFADAQRRARMEEEVEEESAKQETSPRLCDFPRPSVREYILRTVLPRPSPCSRTSPQRMFCTLLDNEFRLAGAFTSDTTFQ